MYKFVRNHRMKWIIICVICCLARGLLANADDAKDSPIPRVAAPGLRVEVTGLKHAKGQVGGLLYRSSDRMGSEVYRLEVAELHNGKAELFYKNLPSGKYGLVVFDDENRNGVLDHNWLNLPKESLAFSGGFVLSLFSGKPKIKDLLFSYDETHSVLEISF